MAQIWRDPTHAQRYASMVLVDGWLEYLVSDGGEGSEDNEVRRAPAELSVGCGLGVGLGMPSGWKPMRYLASPLSVMRMLWGSLWWHATGRCDEVSMAAVVYRETSRCGRLPSSC